MPHLSYGDFRRAEPDFKQNEVGDDDEALPMEFRLSRSKIMYIESKSEGLVGPAVIGRVYFSKSGNTLYYNGKKFRSLKGSGFKSNYFETESGNHYWISGPRKDENNRLYGGNKGVLIDEDVLDEYKTMLLSSQKQQVR